MKKKYKEQFIKSYLIIKNTKKFYKFKKLLFTAILNEKCNQKFINENYF